MYCCYQEIKTNFFFRRIYITTYNIFGKVKGKGKVVPVLN
jgi:hypothetical protein